MVSNSILKGQIVGQLLEDFHGKSVCVDYNGALSGLQHLQKFNCWVAGKRKNILVLEDEDSEEELSLFIDCRKIKNWDSDFISGTLSIDMGSMVVDVYED